METATGHWCYWENVRSLQSPRRLLLDLCFLFLGAIEKVLVCLGYRHRLYYPVIWGLKKIYLFVRSHYEDSYLPSTTFGCNKVSLNAHMCRWCVNDLRVCAWLCWAYFVHCCLGALRCMVMSCSFHLAYAPYGPHQGLSNLVFSCSLRTSSLAMGCSIHTCIFLMGWVAGKHIELGVLTILAFDFCCYNATTKLQPGKFNEGTNMSARTAGKKNFLFPQGALPRGNLWFKSNDLCLCHMMVGIWATLTCDITKSFDFWHFSCNTLLCV